MGSRLSPGFLSVMIDTTPPSLVQAIFSPELPTKAPQTGVLQASLTFDEAVVLPEETTALGLVSEAQVTAAMDANVG